MQAYFFSVTWLLGTGSGVQMSYLLAAALIFVVLGIERILLSAVLGALAVLQVVVLQIMVPYNTGLLASATLFAAFRCHSHCERDRPDYDRHFCPPRSCAG